MKDLVRKYNRRIVSYGKDGKTVIVASTDGFLHPQLGERSFSIPGKGEAANRIAVNIFKLLRDREIPTCFQGDARNRKNAFLASRCLPIPIGFVVRRFAQGSFAERYPQKAGERFEPVLIEMFLKDKELGNPTLCLGKRSLGLHDSRAALHPHAPFEKRKFDDHGIENLSSGEKFVQEVESMHRIVKAAFLLIEEKFAEDDFEVIDIHFEFGVDPWKRVVIMDPIDAKAMRILDSDGNRCDTSFQQMKHLSHRDYEDLKRVLKARYTRLVEVTSRW